MKVYLDMDGVLVDFLRGIHKAFKIDYAYEKYPYPKGLWNMFAHIQTPGIPFEVINAACSQEFWQGLSWIYDGPQICNKVMASFQDIKLLTAPMPNPGSWTGKYLWVKNNLGPCMAKNLIQISMGTSKAVVAGPEALLIDDSDKNVDEFREAGGHAILVPRPWNSNHPLSHCSYAFVAGCIDEIKICMEETV